MDDPRDLTSKQRAFLAGFKASGEGFNGEWPCGDKNYSDEQIWELIKEYYNEE